MNAEPANRNKTPIYILDGLLWLISAALGLLSVEALYRLSATLYALLVPRPAAGNDYYPAVLVGQVTVFIGAIIWLAVMIISGEYHLRHPGERKSWIVFAWTIGVELALIAAGFLLA